MRAKNPMISLEGMASHPIVSFCSEFFYLKSLYRQGWLKEGRGIPEEKCESVADHSFGVAMLSYVIAEEYMPELDASKVIRMALLHDLCEAHAGDTTPSDNVSEQEKHEKESEAMNGLFKRIPNGSKYIQLWEEYEEQKTTEARFVKEIDKLEMAMQALMYETQGGYNVEEFFPYVQQRLSSPEVKKILEDILRIRKK
ncbi:MAG: HD domain-containing protein [Nanoarchaeota archaeon]